jgi:hypothetical protein
VFEGFLNILKVYFIIGIDGWKPCAILRVGQVGWEHVAVSYGYDWRVGMIVIKIVIKSRVFYLF